MISLGVNLIDTADSYGPHFSEQLIHDALYPYPDGLLIATKGGLTRSGPGQWARNGRPDHLREACERSLRDLRVERIDLYQLHAPDPDVPYEESVGALAELQGDGLINHIGVSNVSLEQLEEARSIVEVVTVQNRFNLTDRASQDVLEVCERDGLGFFPWFPLAAGELAKPGGLVHEIARNHDATPGQVALAWLLQRSPVDAADPRHRLARAPAGERRRRRARARRARPAAARRGRVAGAPSAGAARCAASCDGHQIRGPISNVSAGTSTERTRNVSSRTPKATTKPICVRKMSGRTPSTANMPARTMPAEVMTPPVTARPRSMPSRVPWRRVSSRTRAMRKML